MVQKKVLHEATFDPKIKLYLYLYGLLMLLISVIGIPFTLIWFLGLGNWLTGRYYEHLECELTERSLRFKKGMLFMVEKTIPLDNIQDLTFKTGPILNMLGINILEIETAGGGTNESDMKLMGIENSDQFRDAVLSQREKLSEQLEGKGTSSADTSTMGGEQQIVSLLTDIRDRLDSIDQSLKN